MASAVSKHGLAVIDKVLGSWKVYVDAEITARGNARALVVYNWQSGAGIEWG